MTFEAAILVWEVKTRKKGRFKELCSSVFQSPEGSELLAILCVAAHPLDHSDGLTPHQHGQREVIAALWRYGASSNVIYTDPEPQPQQS